MELACVDRETAEKALAEHKTVENAVDALLVKPVVSGERFIPIPPTIDRGMTTEQEERCKKGRWLQDQVNAVFSVAHSQTRTQPDQGAPSGAEVRHLENASPSMPAVPPGSPQDDLVRMTLPTLQSETPP